MKPTSLRLLALALAGAPVLAACAADDDQPLGPGAGGELFARYVALGNSITAGYQSGGIDSTLQNDAYPVLLAAKAGARFDAPLITGPGCPRPNVGPLTAAPAPPAGSPCFRATTPRIVNNLAVPGETIGDLLNLPASPSVRQLHRLLIGDRTQLQAMEDADPTFVSVWIGNNDALNAAVTANPAALTPQALFAARVDSVAARIAAENPSDVMLIGVVDPNIVPLLQPGAFFYLAYTSALAAGQPSPFGRPVLPDCAPGTAGGSRRVSFAVLGAPATQVPAISCDPTAPFVLTAEESQTISQRVTAFNASLQAAATAGGRTWTYVDPNTILAPFAGDPARIRRCQGLATAATPAQIAAAVQNTCPSFSPAVGFGSLFSFDAVHPSPEAHRILANALATIINQKHGLSLPTS
jgi:lysophospholipase L1-like esterase